MSMYDENVIAITNRKLVKGDFLDQLERILAAGVPRLILREKDLSPREYVRLAKQVMWLCENYHRECILHYFVREALYLGAESIHLPLGRALEYRRELKQFKKLGISTHSLEQVRQAEELGADYITYSHVFPTDCKKGLKPKGLESLHEVCEKTGLPVYALGGITMENRQQVRDAGAMGYCMMSKFMRQ